jgi:hypothetical protein
VKIPVQAEVNGKKVKVGQMETYNPETGEATIKLDKEYAQYIHGLLRCECPVSISFQCEPCEPSN